MAAARITSAKKLCKRYQVFFYVAGLLVVMQMYLAYSFYNMNKMEFKKIEEWKEKFEKLEKAHLDHVAKQPEHPPDEMVKLPVPPENNPKMQIPAQNNPPVAINIPVPPVNNTIFKIANLKEIGLDEYMGKDNPKYYEPKCDLEGKDVKSALRRAKNGTCRQEIADTYCKHKKGELYPKYLPRYCPMQGDKRGEYVGCFKDSRDKRRLDGPHTEFKTENSPEKCINFCLMAGFEYAGLQYGYECWCGNLERSGQQSDKACDTPCPGDASKMCGGYLVESIYHTGLGVKPVNEAKLVRRDEISPDIPKIKVVFVLTINGRGVRQVRRLFKALYHVDHYFYIHVDSRQDYMFREMTLLAETFPNVKVAQRRLSTIWGGASLLQMLLNCMEDLVKMKDWKWDFFINLSESDYPVKSTEDLIAFLSSHSDKNFLKSHGTNTPRFVSKQGLDKLFYECETHMWRIGDRELPIGVRIDGGSDWITLNRQFCDYAVAGNDNLVTGLKLYWKYALLPAESFFHTLLVNSAFCGTYVNNNLHLTNWRRKQGCKCQYKHIVDWCGCSPNDFKPKDLQKILAVEDAPIFFARKFEAIVNQEIITEIDTFLDGQYPDDTPGLHAYWQSEFHYKDHDKSIDDAYLTYHASFARRGAKSLATKFNNPGCAFKAGKVQEATIYNYGDALQGYVVLYEAYSVSDGEKYRIEVQVKPEKSFKMIKNVGPISRLLHVEVGTLYDPKEELFRNFGGFIGPFSNLAIMMKWKSGQTFSISVVYIDPANVVAASYDITVEEKEYVISHKPDFAKPLRPGVWTVKLLYTWEPVVELEFVVIPLSHYRARVINDDEAIKFHNGPKDLYVDRDFRDMAKLLNLQDTEYLSKQAEMNSMKTGSDLKEWIDELTDPYWKIEASCRDHSALTFCPDMPSCRLTPWSSKSPDPKSEIGQINPDSGKLAR